jgi:hypothetical protein
MQSWIERPSFHLQQFLRCPLDIPGDCMPMRRAAEQGPQNQKIERALRQIQLLIHVGILLNIQ